MRQTEHLIGVNITKEFVGWTSDMYRGHLASEKLQGMIEYCAEKEKQS